MGGGGVRVDKVPNGVLAGNSNGYLSSILMKCCILQEVEILILAQPSFSKTMDTGCPFLVTIWDL